MKGLAVIRKNDVFTTSICIAEGVGVKHTNVMDLLKRYSHMECLIRFETEKVLTGGRPVEVAYLNEEQATFLITLMKNSEKVVNFKHALVMEFFKLRRTLFRKAVNEKNLEWLTKRQETKIMRKELTDTIQEFVEYAKSQGSKSADKYYMNFSRMELTGLFIIEQRYPNARDVMSVRQLNLIEMADEAIAISLKESMDAGIPYKECYQIAKDKISLLVKIFPRSPLPQLLSKIKDE